MGLRGAHLGRKKAGAAFQVQGFFLKILFWCWVEGSVSADGTGMRGSRHPPPKRALPRSVMPVLEATGAAPEFEEGVRTACWVRGYFMGPEDAYGMWTRRFIIAGIPPGWRMELSMGGGRVGSGGLPGSVSPATTEGARRVRLEGERREGPLVMCEATTEVARGVRSEG